MYMVEPALHVYQINDKLEHMEVVVSTYTCAHTNDVCACIV